MTIWQTPAGIVDEGGMVLQAWLNFGITLVAPPANGLMHVCCSNFWLLLCSSPGPWQLCLVLCNQIILMHLCDNMRNLICSMPSSRSHHHDLIRLSVCFMRIVGIIAVNPLQGIVGGTYDRFLAGQTAVSDPESQLYLPPDVSVPSPACFHACALIPDSTT